MSDETVPIRAENKPLHLGEVSTLKLYLGLLAEGKKLTPLQQENLEKLTKRFQQHGLQSNGEKQIKELQSLLDALGHVVKKPLVAGGALDLYSDLVGKIYDGVKNIKEGEYKKFKQLMQGKTGEDAKKQFEEIKPGLRAEWADIHWIRYQTEIYMELLNAMKKKP